MGLAWSWPALLLTLAFYRKGQDLVASGFLVFVIGEGLILSSAAMDLAGSVPSFGAGTSLWALALVLISIPHVFPLPVRLLGFFAAVLFGVTALQIFAGDSDHANDSPTAVLRLSSARGDVRRLDLAPFEGRRFAELGEMTRCKG